MKKVEVHGSADRFHSAANRGANAGSRGLSVVARRRHRLIDQTSIRAT